MSQRNSTARRSHHVLPRRRFGRYRRPGFSLIDLLITIAICNILISLTFPAVQAARVAANRFECAHHLKQIGLAWQMHHDSQQHFPTGGWGWQWTGDPDRGYGPQQPGGWVYNILPYIEEEAVRNIGQGMSASEKNTANVQRLSTPMSLFNCPSRRPIGLFASNPQNPPAINCDPILMVARGDYAANVGNPDTPVDPAHCGPLPWYCQCNSGPPSLAAADSGSWSQWASSTAFNGISYSRSVVAYRHITDGTSFTVMVGEKYIVPSGYDSGLFGGDNESLYVGFDDDLYRTTGFGPLHDDPLNSDLFRFGSAHPAILNMVFCDGSVRQISYDIDDSVFSALGSRDGGEVIDASGF